MRPKEAPIWREGLPEWLASPKLWAVLFIAFFATSNFVSNSTPASPKKVVCAPFPHGPYAPGTTPVDKWSGKTLEQFRLNMKSKDFEVQYLLDAMERCPITNCSAAIAEKYHLAISSYAWLHVILARDADIVSGDEGVRYINRQFQTAGDKEIVADLKKRVEVGWFDVSRYRDNPEIQLTVERELSDFAICRPTKPNYDLVHGTFESSTRNLR